MAAQIKFFLDGAEVTAAEGDTVLEVARRMGKDIPTLCHDPRLEPFTSCYVCLVEQEGKAGFVPSCGTKVAAGLKIKTDTPEVRAARKMCLELLMSAHLADCVAPCRLQCPGNLDIQTYIAAVANGEFAEALKVIKRTNPFPSVCGRVCPHTCELQCRRNKVDEPVAINPLKRFVADLDQAGGKPYLPGVAPDTGKKVAVIGGGPGGLTAAYYLRQKGHAVTVLEMNEKAGGMLRYGIPRYRLPGDVLDREIDAIRGVGVELRTRQVLGKDFTLAALKQQGFDAVFLAVGAWVSQKMDAPGEDLAGVLPGVGFLFEVASGKKPRIGKRVVVVGGGNTAIDAARTSCRLGSEVTILYRRTRKEMPAEAYEVDEAEREGVKLHFLAAPVQLLGKDGQVRAIKAIRMELGEPDASGRRKPVPVPGSEFEIPVDTVIAAIGQKPDAKVWQGDGGPGATKWATVKADEKTYQSDVPWVFTGGDCLTGAATAIEAIAGGRKAAISIDRFLRSLPLLPIGKPFSDSIGRLEDLDDDMFQEVEKVPRVKTPELPLEKRLKGFAEVDLGITQAQAICEAGRCLECGCTAVDTCSTRKLCEDYGVDPTHFKSSHLFKPVREDHPFILYDPNKCIVCGRCVRICLEQQGTGALGFVRRGFETTIAPTLDEPLLRTDCDACGQCLSTCPTGALEAKRVLPKSGPFLPDCVPVVCGFCGLGCLLRIEATRGRYLRATTEPGLGHNRGNLCVDGSFGHRVLETMERLTTPRIKGKAASRSAGKAKKATWEQALAEAAAGLKKARGEGKDVVVLTNGPLTNEDAYLLQRLARSQLHSNHLLALDGPAEPMAFHQALGNGNGTLSLGDLPLADLVWVVGPDPFEFAPVAGIELRRAALGGVPTTVISGRGTRLDETARQVLRVSEARMPLLFSAMAAHAKDGRDEPLLEAAGQVDLKPARLFEAVAALKAARKPVVVVADAQNQQVLDALGTLLRTAGISGRVLALRRSGNALGKESMGLHPGLLPGWVELGDAVARGRFERAWGQLSEKPGMGLDQALASLKNGKAGAALVINTDPYGLPLDGKDIKRGIFTVVLDLVPGPLAARAEVLLPAAMLAEASGTLTNLEGRILRTSAVRAPAGERTLFQALSGLAEALGKAVPFKAATEVWKEIAELAPGFSRFSPADLGPSGKILSA